MKLEIFKEMINRTVFCALSGIIESRPSHRREEVYLEKSAGKLIMAAANNMRLGFISRAVSDDFPDFNGVIVPAAVLQKIAKRKRGTTPLSISISGNEIHFHIGSVCVSSNLLPGEFIRFYRDPKELPSIFPLLFTVDRLSLLESFRIISAVIDFRWSAVNFYLSPGTLVLHTGDEELSAEDEIPCDYSGDKMTLTFNAKFFREIIEHIDTERVSIRFDDGNATVAVLPEPEQDYHFFIAQRRRN